MSRIVDLTHPIHEGMTTYPADYHARVQVNQLARHGHEGRETREVSFGTHTGTHMDAPRHFIEGGDSVEDLPLDACIGQAELVDMAGDGPPMSLLESPRTLLRFGWGDRWGASDFYDDWPTPGRATLERMTANGVKLVGIDTPSPDEPGRSVAHRYLLGRGIVLLEYLANLDQLEPGPLDLYALPMKLQGCDGAPARVVAVQ